MQRAIIAVLALVLALILAAPLIGYFTGDGASEAGDTAAGVPSLTVAPPEWDAERLVGTAWEADMSAAPEEEWQADMVFLYSFNRPGYVVMRTVDTEAEAEEDSAIERSEAQQALLESLKEAFLPDFEGSYRVEGGTIHLSVPMLGQPRTDSIEIRGRQLYYHGVPMAQTEPVKLGQ